MFHSKRKLAVSILALTTMLASTQSAFAALTIGATSITTDGAYTLNGVAGSVYAIGASTTTGTITIGGTAQTGAITLGSSTGLGQTVNIGSGATTGSDVVNIGTGAATTLKTVNVGTVGSVVSASTVNISNTSDATGTQTVSIGSAAKGANVLTLEGGTAAAAIQIGNGVTAHGIQIGSDATAANAVKLGGANASSVTTIEGGTAAGAILIGNGATAHGIQIGAGNATQTIKIGDHASPSNVITIGGALSTTTITGKTILAGSETIVAGGTSTALSLFKTMHYIDADAGGDIFTLADGAQGQITTILMASSTGTATITPANLAGGTSVTFNAAGDTVVLQFNGTKWWILGGNSYAVI